MSQKTTPPTPKECIEFIDATAKLFSEKTRTDGHQITVINLDDIASHPILGYRWAEGHLSLISPFDDFSYTWTRQALTQFINFAKNFRGDTMADFIAYFQGDDYQNNADEIVESMVDWETSELLKWLASKNSNMSFIDETLKSDEFEHGDTLLRVAQSIAIHEQCEKVHSAILAYLHSQATPTPQ